MGQQKAIASAAMASATNLGSLAVFYPLLEGAIGPVWAGLVSVVGTALLNWGATYYTSNKPSF